MNRFVAFVAATAIVFSPVLPAMAQETARITVTGEGTSERRPDLAVLSLGLTSEAATAAEAMAANSETLTKVLAALKAAGIEDRDLQTSNLSVNPNWSGYDSASGQKITGYTASNLLSVRVRDLDGLGSIIDSAISGGANTINGLSFGLVDPKPAMDMARKSAVADAQAKAALLVEAAGAKLGRIISISEGGGYAAPAPMYRAEAAIAAEPPVEAGEISTGVTVTIVYEIAP